MPVNNIHSCNAESSVLLIYTGGTIGMIENGNTGALEALDFAYIEEHLPDIRHLGFHVGSYSFDPPMDSSDIGPEIWVKIAKVIEENYDKYDGFVVLHGTDTMAYTASALSFMMEGLSKPVLLTGSQLPIGVVRTDGKENLLTSIEIAASKYPDGTPRVQEVAIYFNNKLLRGNRSTKISTDTFNAFDSPNYPYLAHAGINIQMDIHALLPPRGADMPLVVRTQMETNIMILPLYPGMSKNIYLSALNTPGLKAVILKTFGSGNAPLSTEFLASIKNAVNNGVTIVNVSQCPIGTVEMHRYQTGISLMDAGVISGRDMTVEAALTKLMYLIGSGFSQDEVRNFMSVNLRGEVTLE